MRSILVLLILVMIGLNGKGQSVTALPDSVLSQCCLEVTLLNGNVTTVDWVFIQYITRDGTGTKLFVEYAPNFGGIQWETQIRIQDDFDEVLERSKFIMLPFTVGTTDYAINRNWIANIEENTTTGGTWVYGRFGTPTKRKFSAVEDYETLKNLLLLCRPRAIIVAENGLYTEGDTVRMGGFLIEPTRIETNVFNWQMIDTLSSQQFGLTYDSPINGDTSAYFARRWGPWRQVMEMGQKRWMSEVRDTTGGDFSQVSHGFTNGSPIPYFIVESSNNAGTQYSQLILQKNFASWTMIDPFNSNYTMGFQMNSSTISIGANDANGPGNGPSMGAYAFGSTHYLYLKTDDVDNGTASVGQFLQLKNLGTGEVDFATIDLSAYLPISDTAAMLAPYVTFGDLSTRPTGSGTADRSARWSATNTLAAGNFTDNGTKVQALLPFQFQTYTTAGLPTGVTGYHVYNTTTNGPGWYQGSRWAYAPEFTFNRGTTGRLPFPDANGQYTESSNLFWDNSNSRLGIGTSSPVSGITMFGATNQIKLAGSVNNTNNQSLVFSHGIAANGAIASGLFAVPAGSFSLGTLAFAISPTNGVDANPATSGHTVLSMTSSAVSTAKNFSVTNNTTAAVSMIVGPGSTANSGDKSMLFATVITQNYAGLIAKSSGSFGRMDYVGLANNTGSVPTSADVRLGLNNNGFAFVGAALTPTEELDVNGDLRVRDSLRVGSLPNQTSSTDLLTKDASGWIGYRSATGLVTDGNGIISALPNGNVSITTNTNTLTLNGSSLTLQNQGGFNAIRVQGSTGFEGTMIYGQRRFQYFTQLDDRIAFFPGHYNWKQAITWPGVNSGLPVEVDVFGLDTVNTTSRRIAGNYFGFLPYTHQFIVNTNVTANPTGLEILKSNSTSTGVIFSIKSTTPVFEHKFNADGTIEFDGYGIGAEEAADLSKTQSNYIAGFATDGTVLDLERKRDTTVYVDNADLNWSTAITTAQISRRYNRVIFLMTTTAAAGSDSELTLHTPDINLMQVEYLIRSTDEAGGFDNRIIFGTNNAVDSTNGLVTNYYPSAGSGVGIRVGLRSGVYKYWYY